MQNLKKLGLVLFCSLIMGVNAMAERSVLEGQPGTGLRHVVVFKYTPEATSEDIQRITDAFRELQYKIEGITHFEYGVNNSPEGLDQGFSHIYQLTFTDVAARDAYLPHPEHAKFGQLLAELGILDGVFVVDYPAQP